MIESEHSPKENHDMPSSNDGKRAKLPISTLNDALAALEVEMERLRNSANQIEASTEAARLALDAANSVGKAATDLIGPTQALLERLEKVDFPTRLDKVDANVSATGLGIQNIQARQESAERGLREDVRRLQEDVEKNISAASTKTGLAIESSQAALLEAVAGVSKSTKQSVAALKESVATQMKWVIGLLVSILIVVLIHITMDFVG